MAQRIKVTFEVPDNIDPARVDPMEVIDNALDHLVLDVVPIDAEWEVD